jgi:enoyl-CoA hydratase/carnithine racemase
MIFLYYLSSIGDIWLADEAWRLGLVQEVVPADQQVEKAREIAKKLPRPPVFFDTAVLYGVEPSFQRSELDQGKG